jgi:hypothetical protein
MTLTAIDLNYITHRMDMYDIKYLEIYDEINDHIISAVETARADGDQRNIVPVFEELVEKQFPGYWAFNKISKQYEKAYRVKIRMMLWGNMKYYLDWQATLTIIILVTVGFYLPQTKTTSAVFGILLLVVATIPHIYATIKIKKRLNDNGKQSMVKNHIASRSFFLLAVFMLIYNLIGLAGRDLDIHYLNPRYFHPAIYVLLLSFFVIYGLSSMRLCRQELKIGEVN